MEFQTNPQLETAFDFVRNTHKNIFLTGKAGTGKTTFLHQIKKESVKRMVVVAPTGVAAINAGGVTIHSFFQLPFGVILPGSAGDMNRQRKFTREKIRLIQSLDLLVIDEISMVRADVLDGIDEVLRRFKNPYQPFGGVQLLMIGDLHQLPPIVRDEDWFMLRDHYQTAYFFGSLALQKTNPVSIELKHIYRQSDETFIHLLNKVRDNLIDSEVLATLNSRFVPNFKPKEDDAYITLTSHVAAAAQINLERLAAIPTHSYNFKAEIENDFPASAYPTDETLEVKIGAQVMFVKNDISREKLFYNGKIGKVTRIDDSSIFVKCPKDAHEIEVTRVEWENVKYTLNEQTKQIDEEKLGVFRHYPLKLAWAITIHKSQGLTFERAIIDANAAFAHGQVYVALSRCKSFEGIVLRSKIDSRSIKTDSVVQNYTDEIEKNTPDEAQLFQSKIEFQQSLVFELFDFGRIKRRFENLNRILLEHENSLAAGAISQFKTTWVLAENAIFSVAEKFKPQIYSYFQTQILPEENPDLQQRIQKAGAYFEEKIEKELLPAFKNIHVETDNANVRKSATEATEALEKEIFVKKQCFVAAKNGFSAQKHLRTQANAELDFRAAPKPAPAEKVPAGMLHPKLYISLKKWRDETAADLNELQYNILSVKSMEELVLRLPTNLTALRKIKGIGGEKVKQFGNEIIQIVDDYCTKNGIAKPQITLGFEKPDTKKVSFDLFKSGKNLEEIAHERSMVRSTIEGHLAHFIGLGELSIFEMMDEENVHEIAEFFVKNKTISSSEAKAHFGEKYSFGDLKMVQQYIGLAAKE